MLKYWLCHQLQTSNNKIFLICDQVCCSFLLLILMISRTNHSTSDSIYWFAYDDRADDVIAEVADPSFSRQAVLAIHRTMQFYTEYKSIVFFHCHQCLLGLEIHKAPPDHHHHKQDFKRIKNRERRFKKCYHSSMHENIINIVLYSNSVKVTSVCVTNLDIAFQRNALVTYQYKTTEKITHS